MDGTWVLILLAIVMLVGSYVAGSIPLNVSMSEVSYYLHFKRITLSINRNKLCFKRTICLCYFVTEKRIIPFHNCIYLKQLFIAVIFASRL